MRLLRVQSGNRSELAIGQSVASHYRTDLRIREPSLRLANPGIENWRGTKLSSPMPSP